MTGIRGISVKIRRKEPGWPSLANGPCASPKTQPEKRMWKKLILVLVAFVIAPHPGYGQEIKTVLDSVSKTMGEVKSIQYSGSGAFFSWCSCDCA